MKVKVYPMKASALNVRHNVDGMLKVTGSMWEKDGFTSRMLVDNIVTLDADKAWTPEPAPSSAGPEVTAAAPEAERSDPASAPAQAATS